MASALSSEDERLRCGLYSLMTTSFSSPLSTFNGLFPFVVVVSIPLPTLITLALCASSTDFIRACKSLSSGGILIGIFDRFAIFTGLWARWMGGESRINSFITTSESLSDTFNLKSMPFCAHHQFLVWLRGVWEKNLRFRGFSVNGGNGLYDWIDDWFHKITSEFRMRFKWMMRFASTFVTRLNYGEWCNRHQFSFNAINRFSIYTAIVGCVVSHHRIIFSSLHTFLRQRVKLRRKIQFTILRIEDRGKFTNRKNSWKSCRNVSKVHGIFGKVVLQQRQQ